MGVLEFVPGPLSSSETILVTGSCRADYITQYVNGLARGIRASGKKVSVGSPYGATLLDYPDQCGPDDLGACEANILLVDAGTFMFRGMAFAGPTPNLLYTRVLFLARIPAPSIYPEPRTNGEKRVIRAMEAELGPEFPCPVHIVPADPVIDAINCAQWQRETYEFSNFGVGAWLL